MAPSDAHILPFAQPDSGLRERGIPVAEAPLHAAVTKVADTLVSHGDDSRYSHIAVVPELVMPSGRPDIVVAEFDLDVFRMRAAAALPACTAPLPVRVARLIRELGGEATLDELVAAFPLEVTRPRMRNAASSLTRLGLAERRGAAIVLATAWQPALGSVTAVEAKVSHWRHAVRQAQRWESFVEGAWLAFPRRYLASVPREAGLRRFGLIAVESGEARIVRRPRKRRVDRDARALVEEHLYARWLSESTLDPEAMQLRGPSSLHKAVADAPRFVLRAVSGLIRSLRL